MLMGFLLGGIRSSGWHEVPHRAPEEIDPDQNFAFGGETEPQTR
jgi:hypothetical protein